jgi:SagB-type dehydrogenase family enzyme
MKLAARFLILVSAAFLCAAPSVPAQDAPTGLKEIKLPEPKTSGGAPLMDALKNRKSERAFNFQALPEQTLSNLLWAGCGVNRPDGKRTAPTARNWQEIDVYVLLPSGAYIYDAKANTLVPHKKGDLRAKAGMQPFAGTAPVVLVYVADYAKMKGAESDEWQRVSLSFVDTGFVSQNVYLFCSSEGLATVVLGLVDRAALQKELDLPENKKVILSQPVGFRKQ